MVKASCYLSKYEQIKYNAKEIVKHKQCDVYIAKAKKLNKYMIIFSEDELTPNYEIIEKINYEVDKMEEKLKEIQNIIFEHNELINKANEKWDELYSKLEEVVEKDGQYNEIGSMIANASIKGINETDPYECLKIDFNELVKEIENGK